MNESQAAETAPNLDDSTIYSVKRILFLRPIPIYNLRKNQK